MSAGPLDAENPGGGIFPKLDRVSEGRAEQPRRCPGLPKSCGGSPQRRGMGVHSGVRSGGPVHRVSVHLSLGLPPALLQSSTCPEGL